MLTVRTSENTVITSFRLITERQDFSSVRTGENTVRARARIQADKKGEQKNQSARAEVSQSDAPIRRRQIRCSADGLEKQAGNSNVESELGQSLADIKVDKADFRGKGSESDEKK